jgi:hypothetical protein
MEIGGEGCGLITQYDDRGVADEPGVTVFKDVRAATASIAMFLK